MERRFLYSKRFSISRARCKVQRKRTRGCDSAPSKSAAGVAAGDVDDARGQRPDDARRKKEEASE